MIKWMINLYKDKCLFLALGCALKRFVQWTSDNHNLYHFNEHNWRIPPPFPTRLKKVD